MYKISTRGQYALLIMTDLAEAEEGTFIPLKTLSHRRNLSVKYLEQILIQLGKNGLVTGSRGTNGGYTLSKKASDYTAGEILRAMEGELSPRGIPENNHLESEGSKTFWNNFEKAVNNYVDSVTLENLAHKNREFSGFEYCI
ncbi:MAG: Rrf2 family transcriptional regulator [Treponema sp.]|uniref:RrF2 family transcriptional regulator n=1 Tax=Treponema sp. TaxID=166 RepID=UPI00298D862B|nr:Rrf2 family transcriptional regulator [Treponema sp.]MCR5387520.1 Rrf2 family transcriptional regulator [Treponema sp.]